MNKIEKAVICALLIGIGTEFYLATPSRNLKRYINNPSLSAPDISRDIGKRDVDIYNFLKQYAPDIKAAAQRDGLPDIYVASFIVSENYNRNKFEDLKDVLGYNLGKNVSLGSGQVKMRTAAGLDGITEKLSREQREIYRARLEEDPIEGINYISKYLASLKNRPNRFPNFSAEEFANDYRAMGITGSEYMIGPTDSPLDKAEINYYGANLLTIMTKPYLAEMFATKPLPGEKVEAFLMENIQSIDKSTE